MKTADLIHGFRVERIRPMEKDGEVFYELRHEKSGAQLAWMKNEEENKLFSIAFKTIPSDDTGVFHILEHTVLNGSEKYPVKEPFLELLKSSMNTFLNAMTFPDKTVFPVSSRNNTDFMNLTKVYLDAVFRPMIYDNPCIFQQEGWHYELRSAEDTASYKGVVLNEMKGAMSSVYSVIEREMNRILFPDNCYRFVSGGDPESIPNLTYEAYLDAHRTFYNPANAYIYLDGPVDVDAVLELLDREYLSSCDGESATFDIPMQAQIAPTEAVRYYEISPDEPCENRAYISTGKVIGTWEEREKQFAVAVLCEVLTGSNDAVLKRALLDTGLCWDAAMNLYDGILQPYAVLCIQNTDYGHAETLRRVIRETVSSLVNGGVDREALGAAINHLELRLREGQEPKGLERNLSVLCAWLHGGDPLTYIGYDKAFAFLREMLNTDYYEKLLAQMLLDEQGRATVYTLPSQTLGAEQRQAEEQRLQEIQNSWTESQLQEVIRFNERLDAWQQAPDSPEALATLPRLSLQEVSAEPEQLVTEVDLLDGIKVLFHPAREKGIVYLNLYFSVADCAEEELSQLATMTNLLSQLPTKHYRGPELQQKIKSLFGSFYFSVEAFSSGETARCQPFFTVKTSFLEQKHSEALALLGEMLTQTDFDQPEFIKEILLQCQDGFRQGIIEDGHRYAMGRALAQFSAESSVKELATGFEAYQRLKTLLENYDDVCTHWIDGWKRLCERIFSRNRLTVGMTAADRLSVDVLLKVLPQGEQVQEISSYHLPTSLMQGVAIPAGISYAAAGMNVAQCNGFDIAALRVVSTIMSFDYLWNEIRVKGGAYGAGMSVSSNGNLAFYSYRDPAAFRSLQVYREAAAFLRDYCRSGEGLESYIISTIARQEPLLTDGARGTLADELYLRGITPENRRAERKRILSLGAEDLDTVCDLLAKIADGAVCVVGSEDALSACKEENLVVNTI